MIKDLVNKIKTFLNEEIVQEEVQFKDVKTSDGTILSYDKDLAVGIEIFVVDETGRNPAPDGEYILEDGTKLEVSAGVVDSVGAPEAPIETPMETPAPEVSGTTGATLSDEYLKRIENLEAENKTIHEILSQLAESLSKKVFEDEVKMSLVEPKKEIQPEEPKLDMKPMGKSKTGLNSILKNMYK